MRPLVLLTALVVVAAACTSGSAGTVEPDDSTAPTGSAGDAGGDVSDGDADSAPVTEGAPEDQSFAGTQPAPEFPGGLDWLNIDQPLSLDELRGKVVVLDFWTYGCINCIHVIPDLERLEDKYAEELVVIGVHSAKFDNERNTENIRQVVVRYDVEHPVVNDGDFAVWQAYGARAWPTVFVVDPVGNVSGFHAGEGVFEVLDPVISSLVSEFDSQGLIDRTPLDLRLERDTLPETVLSFPGKVAVDGDQVFIADTNHHRIVHSRADGEVIGVYGNGTEGYRDGPALEAMFHEPQGMALGPDGTTLYVADTGNHVIRAVDLVTGAVTTAAGTGAQGAWPPTGGPAASTPLHSPWALELAEGSMYVAMAGTHQIWEFDIAGGAIAPYVGSGAEGTENLGLAASTLAQPSGLALDPDGRLYFADSESSSIRVADTRGAGGVSTVAGSDQGLFDFGDEDGVGTDARLQHPLGVAVGADSVWITDTYNSKIKRIDPVTGAVETFAGAEPGWADGDEPRFYEPGGLDLAEGMLYIADTNNHVIRILDIDTGETSTLVLRGIEQYLPSADDDAYAGRIVPFDQVTVGAGGGSVTLDVTIPAGYKVNPDAPSSFEWSDSAGAATIDGSGVRIDPAFPIVFDATFIEGSTTLIGDVSVVYCDAETEAICLFEQVRVEVPLTVVPDAPDDGVVIVHEIVLPEF